MSQCLIDKSKGCIEHPVLIFDTCDIVCDELHIMLRITDILLHNLIWSMELLDSDAEDREETHLNAMIDAIRSCGISFAVKLIII